MSNWTLRFMEIDPAAEDFHRVDVRHLPREDGGDGGHAVVEFTDGAGTVRTRHNFRTTHGGDDVRYEDTDAFDPEGGPLHTEGNHPVRALTPRVLWALSRAGFGLRVRED